MKRIFQTLIAIAVLLIAMPVMALQEDGGTSFDPANIAAMLTPLVVLLVTYLVRKFSGSISGTVTLLVVAVLSALATWVTQALGDPDISGWAQFGLGLVATFIHQLKVQLQE